MSKNSKTVLETVIRSGHDRLASDIVALDVAEISPLADYFVLMSVKNDRQLKAATDAIEESLIKAKLPIKNIEGKDGGRWVLLDCYDVIAHIFLQDERETYQLEKLWHEAPMVNIEKWLD